MKNIIVICCCLSFVLGGAHAILASMNSSNYQIWQDAISVGGGDDQTSDTYTLGDTLGEAGIGIISSSNYSAGVGFREVDFFDGAQVLSLSASSGSVDFGALSTDSTKTGSVLLTVDTNSGTGVSVTYSGSTLTCSSCSGTNTITAAGSSAVASSIGTSQFGFNAIYSSGSSPSASSISPYNVSGQYAFSSGSEIISSSGAINPTTFSINFIANISGNESAGTYTTTIVYTATASF